MAVVYWRMGQTSAVYISILYTKLEGEFHSVDGTHLAQLPVSILGFNVAEWTPNVCLSLDLQFECIFVAQCICSIICETVVCDDCRGVECLCLVAVVSIAFVHRQGYFVVGSHHCSVFSHCPSLVRFVGNGTDFDGGRQNDQYRSSAVVFTHPFDLCIDVYTQSFDW